MKKVVLRFVDYNPSTDLYSVTSELWEDNKRPIQLFGKLPSTDSILTCYRNWQALYLALLQRLENRSLSEEIVEESANSPNNNQSESENQENQDIEIDPGITNISEQKFYDLCQVLKKKIDDWLNYIVMREDIPNQVAQEFLKSFLAEFSSGKSLPIALRRARERLESIENKFPCASWLPVLCKNSATTPITWRMMLNAVVILDWLPIIAAIAFLIIGGIKTFKEHQPSQTTILQSTSICNQKLNTSFPISCGEKIILNPKDRPPQHKKVEGVNAIAIANYPLAVKLFEQAWVNEKDPETLIYLNNAKIYNAKNVYTLAVVIPFSNAPDFISYGILQGVAEVQDRVNKNQTQWKLRIAIADDYNQFGQAQNIARELGKRTDVLGVIGHYSSHLTANVKDIYQKNQLVLISPTATSDYLTVFSNQNNFFFRSTPTNKTGAKNLANYLIDLYSRQIF
jgi:branched-chain amino acid transport system substrate-binding protein